MKTEELAEKLERLDALFVELYNYAESQSLSDTMSKSGANALRAIMGSIGNRYNVIPQAAARLRSMEEALRKAVGMLEHVSVTMDWDEEEAAQSQAIWDADVASIRAALSGEKQ